MNNEESITAFNSVLNDIRPAMEADGGGVDVVGYNNDNSVIFIQFKGACIHCPSQALTFKHSIEATLKSKFPHITAIHIRK